MRRFGSIYWHCLAGQTVYPVQVAVKFKIPLIIWGAHQGIDQVGMFSHLDEVEMTRKYRKEHDLMGYEAEDLISDSDGISERDIFPWRYPDNRELEEVGVRGIYLNNYIRWDSRIQHEQMIRLYNYESGEQTRTFDTYNDVDCWNYSDVHDYIKFIKHGYGKVTDHVCREIRLKHMTREAGLELMRQYGSRPPQHLDLFLNWLGITENAFYYIIDQHRNPAIWARNNDWQWEIIDPVIKDMIGNGVADELSHRKHPADNFWLTPEKASSDKTDKYILIGKGV
jgi:hypothetical protein